MIFFFSKCIRDTQIKQKQVQFVEMWRDERLKKRTIKQDMIKESQIGKTSLLNWLGFNNVNILQVSFKFITAQRSSI